MCDRYPYTIKAARFLPPPVGLSAQAKGFPSVMEAPLSLAH